MKNILFFMETVDFGGAETVFTNIIKNINKSKFCIKVVTERDHELFTDEIKAAVPYDCFIKTERSAVRDFWNKIVIKLSLVLSERNIRKYFIRGNYDVEVAFCEGYSTKIIGNSGKRNCKKIAWVHTDVIKNPWSEKIFGSAEEEKKCYEKFDAIVCVAETMKESFIKKYVQRSNISKLFFCANQFCSPFILYYIKSQLSIGNRILTQNLHTQSNFIPYYCIFSSKH